MTQTSTIAKKHQTDYRKLYESLIKENQSLTKEHDSLKKEYEIIEIDCLGLEDSIIKQNLKMNAFEQQLACYKTVNEKNSEVIISREKTIEDLIKENQKLETVFVNQRNYFEREIFDLEVKIKQSRKFNWICTFLILGLLITIGFLMF